MQLINLSSGASHFPVPDAAKLAAIQAIAENKTVSAPPAGLPDLHRAIMRRYREDNGVSLQANQLLVTPGTKFAVYAAFAALLKPGDEVILPKPFWFGFEEMLEALQLKLVPLPTQLEENYALQPEALEELLTERTRMLVLCNPSNPTGRIYSREEIKSILEPLQNRPEVYVLSDEIYDLITFTEPVPSLLELPDPHQRHLVVNGFNKNFSMSGWRLGYLVAPEKVVQQCLPFLHNTTGSVASVLQYAGAATLEQRKSIVQQNLPQLHHHRELLCQVLDQFPEIRYFKPEGTYYVFADFSSYIGTHGTVSGHSFFQLLKSEAQLELYPGEAFGAPGFARITFAVSDSDLRIGTGRLEAFLRQRR